MKIALVTTSINVPRVLKTYAGSGIGYIVVAGDEKTPHGEARQFCESIAASYLHPDNFDGQWKHARLLGKNTDSLRNIAVLHALSWGADVIVSVDDDMVCLDPFFFERIREIFDEPFSGVCLGRGDSTSWFDAGSLTIPPARQRGLPTNAGPPNTHEFVSDIQVGAMQGIILGVPDTDAATTIVNRPLVHSASDILQSGFVVDPSTKAVFNSQITAFRRELAPAFAQFYKWQGRNTDIIASVLMRRIMRDRNLYTYFGPPMAYHARAPREPQKDMNAEQWGLNKIGSFQNYLDNTNVFPSRPNEPVTGTLRRLYEDMLTFDMWPRENIECALAWIDDVESVL